MAIKRDTIAENDYFGDFDSRSYNCWLQFYLYEKIREMNYDIVHFSNAFMKSEFCKKYFDTKEMHFNYRNPKDMNRLLALVLKEFKDDLVPPYNDIEIYEPFISEAGLMYRMMHYRTRIPSSKLVELVNIDILFKWGFQIENEEPFVSTLKTTHLLSPSSCGIIKPQ